MTWLKKTLYCPVPKANNDTILSNEYVDQARALVIEFGEIPVIGFASLWFMKYGQIMDFAARRYDGGLTRFLKENNHLFDLKRDKRGILLVSLVSRPVSGYSTGSGELGGDISSDEFEDGISRQKSMELTATKLFDPNNYLWKNMPWRKYLNKKEIYIVPSAFEMAHDINSQEATRLVKKIRRVLSEFPKGLKSDQLYKYIDIKSALKIFGVSISINSLIDELPELFYRQIMDRTEEDLIFDGAHHTHHDLTGCDDAAFERDSPPETIVTQAITSGLYQKTLILIYETGRKGLKINVWSKSLKMNFYAKNENFEQDLKGFKTMTFFLALARSGLVELRPDRAIKNDIRAFLPQQDIRFFDTSGP